MRTEFFKLTQQQIAELDKERFNDEAEEELQQQMWQQNHLAIVESQELNGEIAITLQ